MGVGLWFLASRLVLKFYFESLAVLAPKLLKVLAPLNAPYEDFLKEETPGFFISVYCWVIGRRGLESLGFFNSSGFLLRGFWKVEFSSWFPGLRKIVTSLLL
jgi:hypothetical protein